MEASCSNSLELAPTQCQFCGRAFKRPEQLDEHRKVHDESKKIFACTTKNCPKKFSSRVLLRKHLATHNERQVFKCPDCKKEYKAKQALIKHRRTHNEQKRFTCPVCSRQFHLSEPYKVHLRKHDGSHPFTCGVCRKSFASRAVCRRHKQRSHPKSS